MHICIMDIGTKIGNSSVAVAISCCSGYTRHPTMADLPETSMGESVPELINNDDDGLKLLIPKSIHCWHFMAFFLRNDKR